MQWLASDEQVRRVTDWGREERWGGGRAEGLSAIDDGGQAAISLMPDVDGTASGEFNSTYPLEKMIHQCLGSSSFFNCHRLPHSTRLHPEWLLQPSCTVLHSGPVLQKLTQCLLK